MLLCGWQAWSRRGWLDARRISPLLLLAGAVVILLGTGVLLTRISGIPTLLGKILLILAGCVFVAGQAAAAGMVFDRAVTSRPEQTSETKHHE